MARSSGRTGDLSSFEEPRAASATSKEQQAAAALTGSRSPLRDAQPHSVSGKTTSTRYCESGAREYDNAVLDHHTVDEEGEDELRDGEHVGDDSYADEAVEEDDAMAIEQMESSAASSGPAWATQDAETIVNEMVQLVASVPQLQGNYVLVSLLGEGTFSTVYKAIDVRHNEYHNVLWTTPWAMMPVVDRSKNLRDPSLAFVTPAAQQLKEQRDRGKVYVALKRIYVTSSPERIMGEIDILNSLRYIIFLPRTLKDAHHAIKSFRGQPNVAFLISAMRHLDQVIVIMPFNRHQDFREYYNRWTLPLLRSYFASLLRALAATHLQLIIHRDVKPANFLFDTHTGTGVLCDYGLAERVGKAAQMLWTGQCCHSLPGPSTGGLRGRARNAKRLQKLPKGHPPGLNSGLHGARLSRPMPTHTQIAQQNVEWHALKRKVNERGNTERDTADLNRLRPWLPTNEDDAELMERKQANSQWYSAWRPTKAAPPQAVVGVLRDEFDRRPPVRANRAGTRGFRAPEVLLKCPDQTVAVDIWSVGITILCFLTYRFPFFHSNDDTEALAELTAIFGRSKMEQCAAMHNRTFSTNIPTYERPAHPSLDQLVRAINPAVFPSDYHLETQLVQLIDLMRCCLELDLTQRWTAEELLEHPFFDGEYDMGDGRLGPRGPLHSRVADWES